MLGVREVASKGLTKFFFICYCDDLHDIGVLVDGGDNDVF